jgi:DNA primase
MSGSVPEEVIDNIRERADIVEIISEYLPLKKAGKNYKALCPFHQERTPSFMVSPEKQLFHCFGCGVGGNVFSFLMKWEKITFPEAIRNLGEKVGIPVSFSAEEKRTSGHKEELYSINKLVAEIFQEQLKKNRQAQAYLKERGFNEETVATFRIGFAPSSKEFLRNCQKRDLSREKLEELGLLLTRGKEERAYFRYRIILPIFTPRGRICGFGARVMDDSMPKYLNSSESPIFDKGKTLYGLNFSKEAVRRENEAILVEGYTDLIYLHQVGIKNVVASLGTSLTPWQARTIKRYTNQIFIAYDQDRAGVAATLRGIDLLLEEDLRIKVIPLPRGKDPADLVKESGELFLRNKAEAIPYFDYRLQLEMKKRPSLELEDKIEILNALFPTLGKNKNLVRIREFIKKLSHQLDLDEESIGMEFEKFQRKGNKDLFRSPSLRKKDGREEMEKMLLQLMLDDEEIINMVEKKWDAHLFRNPPYHLIAEKLINSLKEGKVASAKLAGQLEEENLSSLISSFSLSKSYWKDDSKQNLVRDLIGSLERNNIQRRINELREKIKAGEDKGEEKKVERWLQELTRLKKQIISR